MQIGFIGLGIMGAPMAGHLIAAGHRLTSSVNRKPAPADLVSAGLEVLKCPREVAAGSDIIILMLPDTPDVERVLHGEEGVIAGLKSGSLVIDMSSIDPGATRELAGQIEDNGCQFLDAPVSGGEVGAKAATLTIMVGGPKAAFERALPIFQKMGKNISHVGEANGSGQVCKIANQLIVGQTLLAVSEALVLAKKSGCDPESVRAALMGGFASSRILEVHGLRMTSRKFDPGFRIALHLKDLGLAIKAAKDVEVAVPMTAVCHQLFSSSNAQGDATQDHSAIFKVIERMSGIDG